MMVCNNCKYVVDGSLKFAVANNVCPKCGSNILSDSELSIVGDVNNKMKECGFSSEIEKYTLYTISLFIYNNYIKNKDRKINEMLDEPVVGQLNSDKESNNLSEYVEEHISDMDYNDQAVDNHNDDSVMFSEEEYAYEKTNDIPASEDLRDEDKVERLKRIARESKLGGKTGVMVRRFES